MLLLWTLIYNHTCSKKWAVRESNRQWTEQNSRWNEHETEAPPVKLKPENGSKQRAAGVLKARTKKDGRSLSLRGFSCFVSAYNLVGPVFAAGPVGTCLLRPMPVKAEKNQFFLPAAYKAAHVLFPELP